MSILNFDVRNDQMLFVDGEFTCFDGPPPPGEIPEMIEMGVANLDLRTLTIDRYDSYLIKNTLSSISPKCTELTGITQEKLDKEGRHLGEVMQSFRKKYGPANKAVGAWGKDEQAIRRDCINKKVDYPFSGLFYDFGRLHTLMVGTGKAIGLKAAIQGFGLEPYGTHHSGVDDAIELARYFIAMTKMTQNFQPSENLSEDIRIAPKR